MRTLVFAIAATIVLAGTASAKDMKACSADWNAAKTAHTTVKHKDFIAGCLKGAPAAAPAAPAQPAKPSIFAHHAPAAMPTPAAKPAAPAVAARSAQPAGATALCKDGSWSLSKTHSGSCSHHGGVAKFL
jgi:hypothetical protein